MLLLYKGVTGVSADIAIGLKNADYLGGIIKFILIFPKCEAIVI